LPARLADGLGLESGLETGCPVSFAPSEFSFGIWVSRARLQEGSPTSAATASSKSHPPRFVKCRMNTAFFLTKKLCHRPFAVKLLAQFDGRQNKIFVRIGSFSARNAFRGG
jgi:hypothetical protein